MKDNEETMEPPQTTCAVENAELQPPPPVVQRQNPKWVGPIMALFLPGSAHFFAGQRRTGLLLYFALFLLVFLTLFTLSVSGVGFFYATVGLIVIYALFFIGVLISSWRPTRRIGCVGWLLFLCIVFFLQPYAITYPAAMFMKTFVVELYIMNSAAMSPTLIAPSARAPEVQIPDRVVASRWIYHISDPHRGDIVIFTTTNTLDGLPQNRIMRIVGLPDETIDIESPYVLINGERLTKPSIFARIASRQDGFTGYSTVEDIGLGDMGVPLPLTLGHDEYFVLGDNAPHSSDSRFWEPVRRQDITGKAIRIFRPLNRVRELE